jgi:hypothetical protein
MSDLASAARPSLRIGQYWDAEEVPPYIEDLSATFRAHNPDFDHRIYSEADTERLIRERFGSRELAAFQACAVASMQSDYFRYCFLLAFGGIYADVDYRCVRSLRPLLDGPTRGEIFLGPGEFQLGGREASRVWSGFLAFSEPGHPFLRLALDIATANLEARIAERVWPVGHKAIAAIWLTAGPGILTAMRLIRDWGSFDAFLDGIVGTEAEPFGELYCETIGDYERVEEAFEGVRVSPFHNMLRWVEDVPVSDLPYKETDTHWHNVSTAIFRQR